MGTSDTVYFTVDTTRPEIATISQFPLKDNMQPTDEVKVNATITDMTSLVRQVFLNYTTNNSTWFQINMIKLKETFTTRQFHHFQTGQT